MEPFKLYSFLVSEIRNILDAYYFFVRKLAKSNIIFGVWHLNKSASILMMINSWSQNE